MRIATFNANSLRSRLDIILKWLGTHQPDILAIQETKVQDKDFPIEAFDQTGYHVVYRGQKSYNGVALLSQEPPVEIVSHLSQDPTDAARFLKAKIGPVVILNTYIPQGMDVNSEKFRYKLDWFQWLHEYLQTHHHPEEPLIWLGDFNVARQDIDVHDPKRLWGHVCFCKPVQGAIENIAEWGFIDVFRKFHPEPDHYTFWDYRAPNGFKRNIGWRLDYIMATAPLAKACINCQIDKEPRGWPRPSDHTFLMAEFEIE
ncbi:MAG: exodeoxyribonuclease III [Planctomycetes bacterium]|nr:exodeoxyribonuclease III [Planctomycetota bacterium]